MQPVSRIEALQRHLAVPQREIESVEVQAHPTLAQESAVR
jgi:hypothetical protein